MAEAQEMTKTLQSELAIESVPRYRRKRWIIDPKMQVRYVIQMVAVAAVAGGIAAYGTSLYFLSGADAWMQSDNPINRMFFLMWLQFAAMIVLVVPLAGIFFSHRFAGPAYRLSQAADQVARGDLDCEIKLRRRDHLVPQAQAFNRMLECLKQNDRRDSDRRRETRRTINLALEKLESADASDFPEVLRMLEEIESKMR